MRRDLYRDVYSCNVSLQASVSQRLYLYSDDRDRTIVETLLRHYNYSRDSSRDSTYTVTIEIESVYLYITSRRSVQFDYSLNIGRVSRCMCRHAYSNDDDHCHNHHNHHTNDNHDNDDKKDKQRSLYRPRMEKASGALFTLHEPSFGGIVRNVIVQTITP